MAAARFQLCSICQGGFTDPVTLRCGHHFCKTCITEHWTYSPQCPNCDLVYHTRPDYHVNTQFRQSADILCDDCPRTKLKAVKSCLVCLASYCENHLKPHVTKKHQLIDPVENPKDRMCMKHNKLLELFCKTDQMCVCKRCTVVDHKTHDVVPLKEGYKGKKAALEKTEDKIPKMIQKRRLKIEEMIHSVKLSQEGADRAIAGGVQVFTALKESVERSQAEFFNMIDEKQRKTEKQAGVFINDLEQELYELEKRSTKLEQLSQSEDHLHLLQNFASLNVAPPTRDWTKVSIHPPSYEGTLVRAVNQLEQMLRKQKKLLVDIELKRFKQYAVDVTLDPDTAHPNLILSGDRKKVKHGDMRKNLPDNKQRFDTRFCLLAKQGFSSGRFYYEVQVKGKTKWNLGVVRESIKRKGKITACPQNGYWMIWLRNENEYKAFADRPVSLDLTSRPEKVGVFVNYEEGLVSFYDVDTAALIYSFTGCSFTEKLHPYFGPCANDDGENSAPLIICPVNHTV